MFKSTETQKSIRATIIEGEEYLKLSAHMSMYRPTLTRARVLRNQADFHVATQIHADDLLDAVLRLVLQELFIAAAATMVAWAYMHTAMRFGAYLAVEA